MHADQVQIYQAFQTFAVLVETKSGQSKASSKQGRLLAAFFESHVLGIMAHFSDFIDILDGLHPTADKVRCIKAIEEMLRLAKGNIAIAIPQIRASLQSAVDQEGLRDAAFSAWLCLMTVLDADDALPLLDHLFALLSQHWNELSSETQQLSHDTIGTLFRTHRNIITDEVMTIPSIAGIPLMSKFTAEINRLKESRTKEQHLQAFAKRLKNENTAVVLQALEELRAWLDVHQTFVHEAALSEPPGPFISALTRALLDVCVRNNSTEGSKLIDLAAQCLGTIGSLDPNRVEANVANQRVLVLMDFVVVSEVVEWVAALFTEVLVPAFKSTKNARAQGFLAFVIQEMLKFSGFGEVAFLRIRSSQPSPLYQRWQDMPENVRNTLTPFLTSRYVLSINIAHTPLKYPVFSLQKDHATWLRSWLNDMLLRAKGANPSAVFPLLARVARNQDVAIAKWLLPYATLNIILGGDVREVKEVADELLVVLSTESSIESEKENLRQCSEVCVQSVRCLKTLVDKDRTCSRSWTTCHAGSRKGEEP